MMWPWIGLPSGRHIARRVGDSSVGPSSSCAALSVTSCYPRRQHHLFSTLHSRHSQVSTVLLAGGAQGVALVCVCLTFDGVADHLPLADTVAPATMNVVAIQRQSGYFA